ncbi:MAG TPA: methylglyoxal synthase [Gammaproteobacteria bacterium]|nr:methylglyoxal synthase [Gammaproteobacteria bacterium]
MSLARTVIVIAHERKVPDLVKLIRTRIEVFQEYRLLATLETGTALEQELGLEVTSLFSGHKGGEIQLCGLVCSNTIRAVYFLRDPVAPAFDEPDITPFYRACDTNNVPMATNMVAAVALTYWLGRHLQQTKAVVADAGGVD